MDSERPLILGFDTSAAHCAAALVSGERVLSRRIEPMARGQAERLLPLIEECLAEAGTGWAAIDALAVCTGPGNFTGIRLAVAAARGLALALGRPAIGVSRFEAFAWGRGGPVLALARNPRGEPHGQFFEDGKARGGPMLDAAALPSLPRNTLVRGHAAAETAQRLGLARHETVEDPDPAAVAGVALARLAVPSSGRPVPLYLREADAAPSSDPVPVLLDAP